MRITIIQDDGMVGVDGVFRQVDLSELDPAIRAVQFDTLKGAGHIEFDRGALIEVDVRDEDAERAAVQAAGDDREALARLGPMMKKAWVARPNEPIDELAPYQIYVERWTAAAPPPPAEPTAEELAAREREKKRSAALRALDDKRLAEAALDPLAPQEVKDYAAVLEVVELPAELG